jgi:hypothetical protein
MQSLDSLDVVGAHEALDRRQQLGRKRAEPQPPLFVACHRQSAQAPRVTLTTNVCGSLVTRS